jgi:putative tricarboxylic transport membrane protein
VDLIHNLALGFTTALSLDNVFYCFVGALLGTLIGVLPGVGTPATVAMLLPITFAMQPASALIMLAGIYYGAAYGGSTTAILVNVPGESGSVVTALDGYQMARQGRAGAALAIAAIGSFVAGTLATLIIALFAPPLARIALNFGPAEYFSLIVLGLMFSVTLAHGPLLKALAMVGVGLLLGSVGTDVYTGEGRFTFGLIDVEDGFDIVAVAVGVFGFGEILQSLEDETNRPRLIAKITGLMPTREDLRQAAMPILRGSLLGSFLGILPGGGATLSSFIAYGVEKRFSRRREHFGKGAIEGVAAPESANNAASQTSFIPMLTLGIPSNPVMALMIGALLIQGLVPGPKIALEQPTLFWGLITSMWIGNLMLVVLNLPLIGIWVRLLTIPYYVLFPTIVAFSALGVFTVNFNVFDLFSLAGFGILGYALVRLGFEPAPLLLGFVLGPMLEEYLRRAMLLSRGSPAIFYERPISAALLTIAGLMLLASLLPAIARRRQEVFVDEN